MFGRHFGVDLGTANVLISVPGQGIILNEPSVVAITKRSNLVEAVGSEALKMLGRTPGTIDVVRPMREGVIADYLVTETMLKYFLRKVVGGFWGFRTNPRVMLCVPYGATSVERRAVREAAEQAGARKPVWLIEEPLAAALGARLPVRSVGGNMVVDIGGGRSEAAVVSYRSIVVAESVRVAGDKMDDAIINHVRRRHNVIIGERTAEEIKLEVGSALLLEEPLSIEVRGRDQVSGLPRTIEVTSKEVTQALQEPLAAIVGAVRAVLERTPPEMAADISNRGIVLTGGSALLRNLDRLLSQETGVPCMVATQPLDCVALGAAMALDELAEFKPFLPLEEESLVSAR